MDFRSTVYRSSPTKESSAKYHVRSQRVPIDSDEGFKAVENLLMKEKRVRREHYKDRGTFAAMDEQAQQDGESGLWSVVDFTGKYHRPLMEQDPVHQIPGRALVREDARPTLATRTAALDEIFERIEASHERSLQKAIRHERTRGKVAAFQSGAEQTLRAAEAAVEQKVMLAEVALAQEQAEEKEATLMALPSGKHHARPAASDDESLLLAAVAEGREQTVRRLIRVTQVDVQFADPLTGRTVLHLAWDCWKARFGILGAVNACMVDDPRYGRMQKLRDLSRVPREEASLHQEPTPADAIEGALGSSDGKAHPNAGPQAKRAQECFEAAASTEYMVALILESVRLRATKAGTPWAVRDFVNAADKQGRTPLHVACERGHTNVVHELLLLGANMRCVNDRGETAVAILASRGQIDCLRYVTTTPPTAGGAPLSHRLGLDKVDNVGRAAIHRVYEFWREAEVHVDAWGDSMPGAGTGGVDRGAHPREGPRHGTRGIDSAQLQAAGLPTPQAAFAPSLRLRQTTTTCAILLLLAKCGASVLIRARNGASPLHEAVRRRVPEAVRCLLAFGADIDAFDERGHTPLKVWKLQASMVLNEEEQGRRVQIGNLLKCWSRIKESHLLSEFYVSWSAWLKDPLVASVPFAALEDAFRLVRLDELELVKMQGDRHGRLAGDTSWAAWAEAELKLRNNGAAPALADKSQEQIEAAEKEAEARIVKEKAEHKARAEAEAQSKRGANKAKKRWGKIKLTQVTLRGALKNATESVRVDPLERGRAKLMADQFEKLDLPDPSDRPIPFELDSYLYSTNPNARQIFTEPHKPDPYRDIPVLQKSMEVTRPSLSAFGRPNDMAQYHTRRRERWNDFMEDALRPECIKVPAGCSVLGGSRWVPIDPNKPPEARLAGPAIRDLARHDAKYAGIKRYVELTGEKLAPPPLLTPPQPFQARQLRDLNEPPVPMEPRVRQPGNGKSFGDPGVLPKFPVLHSPEKALQAARDRAVAEAKAARKKEIKRAKIKEAREASQARSP